MSEPGVEPGTIGVTSERSTTEPSVLAEVVACARLVNASELLTAWAGVQAALLIDRAKLDYVKYGIYDVITF